jgi:hypothetical protein
MYACFTATWSDRRLFIADAGNHRIISVKLGYHTSEYVKLRANTGQAERTDGKVESG